MTTKRCKRCLADCDITEFYRHAKSADGLQSICKSCSRDVTIQWRAQNPDMPAAYQRRYRADPERRREAARRSREAHPVEARARAIVREMVDSGQLERAKDSICFDCGQPADQYDHAYGYVMDMAFLVEPVCYRCHGIRSRERGEHVHTSKAGGRELDGRTWDEYPREATP